MLSLTLILFLYFYPVVRDLILHWSRSIFASILEKDNRNVFVRHDILCCAKFRTMPYLYASAFATEDYHNDVSFSWNKDGITFVMDNYSTVIKISQLRLFTVPLIPKLVTLETAEGLTATTKIVGSMKLILTDEANKHHLYIIPCCVFDPNTPVNILCVLDLGKFFGDNTDATDPLAEDVTTIKLGSTKSHFIWDHGRHERQYMHGSSRM